MFETKAWHEPGAVVVAVRVVKENYLGESVKSCVQQPTNLIVELATGAVSASLKPVNLYSCRS